MRTPIFPNDLLADHGFKHIAKKLMKRWPGSRSINLSAGREILSRGLGYKDYHDVHAESTVWAPDAPVPTLPQVNATLARAITDALLKGGEAASSQADIQRLADSLPWSSLTAFTSHPATQWAGTSPQAAQSPDHENPPQAKRLSKGGSIAFDPESSVVDPRDTRPSIDLDQWESIEKAVHESGNLRDLALLACIRTGLRSREYLGLRVRDVKWGESVAVDNMGHASLRYLESKSNGLPIVLPLARSDASAIQRYVESANIGADSFLFPSRSNSGAPMSSRQLGLRCQIWEAFAKLKYGTVTPYRIRSAVIDKAMKNLKIEMSSVTGHTPVSTCLNYVKMVPPIPEE